MAQITAQEAAQIIASDPEVRPQRRIPGTSRLVRRIMVEEAIPVCNVGPWAYHLERPSISVFVPAYDPAKDSQKLGYAASEPFPGLHRFAKIVDEHEMGWCEDDGRMVLNDLIGLGVGLPSKQALTRYGVFIPEGQLPTLAEIQTANQRLAAHLDELIEEARDAYDKGADERKAVISDRHYLAARIRGIDDRWVNHAHTEELIKCEMCGKRNPTGVAKCACGTIINFDLFRKIQAQQEQLLEAATRPTPKK